MSGGSSVLGDKIAMQQHHDDEQSRGAASAQPPPYTLLTPTPASPNPQPAGPASTSSSPAQTPTPTPRQTNEGLPNLNYSLYSPPSFQLSADRTTLTSQNASLSQDASALEAFLRSQATVPPKPQIHIKGSVNNNVQFDLHINLMGLLIPESPESKKDYLRLVSDGELAYRGGIQPELTPATGPGGLAKWCKRFVEDPAPEKTFVMTRVVANLDTTWLEGQLRGLILSTGFQGAVAVEFPVTHSKVVVQAPAKGSKRFKSLSGMWASLKSKTCRFEVVQSVWPFASEMPGVQGRQYVVKSEENWWREWKDAIRFAVATQKKGWITVEDKLEALMEGTQHVGSRPEWGEQYVYSSQESISKV
ncbi:unnamed protein product [Clonostachys byssicola]|uniref:Uncharacterized protein n=1 Tax=Clonostachys byssicola TaxID=160290 RepID=A0A9N9U9I0_9HYPO|nr:unnamed protein product [Clonostachys byssicola]